MTAIGPSALLRCGGAAVALVVAAHAFAKWAGILISTTPSMPLGLYVTSSRSGCACGRNLSAGAVCDFCNPSGLSYRRELRRRCHTAYEADCRQSWGYCGALAERHLGQSNDDSKHGAAHARQHGPTAYTVDLRPFHRRAGNGLGCILASSAKLRQPLLRTHSDFLYP
jgi:hypothetical protein